MNLARLAPSLVFLAIATSLAAQDAGTGQQVRFPSLWRWGIEIGGSITHETLMPPEKGATVGGVYGCLGIADVPGTEIGVTGCAIGAERVHEVHGADFSAVFTEPRFVLVGGGRRTHQSWNGGIMVQVGYGWTHASTDTLPGGDIKGSGLFWSPGVFASWRFPAPGGLPRWALTGRIGGVTLFSLAVVRYF